MSYKKLIFYVTYVSSCIVPFLVLADTNTRFDTDERQAAFRIRVQAAQTQTLKRPPYSVAAQVNPDEINVPDYAGSYRKLFEHDAITGVLTAAGQAAFEQMVKAMESGLTADFNAIQFAPGNERSLINPRISFSFSMQGEDSCLFSMPTPPSITSVQGAADMVEVYLQAICRDVSFSDYGTGLLTDSNGTGTGPAYSITNAAAAILNDFGSAYTGPRNSIGLVDATVLFRGVSQGDQVGPYISQFLLQPLYPLFPAGCAGFVAGLIGVSHLDQDVLAQDRQIPIAQQREFGVSWSDFIALQNGSIPKQYTINDYSQTNVRYPINGRDMASFVHSDSPFDTYTNTLNILGYRGFPISPNFPYSNGLITKESAGFDMGLPDAYTLVGGVCIEAFKAAWAQKFRAWRRLRPEAFAGLIHQAQVTGTNPYNLHASLFSLHAGYDLLTLVQERNALQALSAYDPQQLLTVIEASTYLLAQTFPEGCPTHPAYPSAHATVAGACVTVIKAIFNDQALLLPRLTPVTVNPNNPTQLVNLSGQGETLMTVGSELDKLASNISMARNFAGVHYRWDAEQGIYLGERVGVAYLQDRARTYPEAGFTGYQLTTRDGTRINITADAVTVISHTSNAITNNDDFYNHENW